MLGVVPDVVAGWCVDWTGRLRRATPDNEALTTPIRRCSPLLSPIPPLGTTMEYRGLMAVVYAHA